MDDLVACLGALEARLRDWGAPVIDGFLPGAPAEAIEGSLSSVDCVARREALTWWGWHDGARGPQPDEGPGIFERPEAVLVEPWHVISLSEAVRIQRWHRAEGLSIGDAELVMPLGWFPVVHAFGGAFLCLDTNVPSEQEAPLYMVDPPGGQPWWPLKPQFGSLAEFVALLVAAFDAGEVQAGSFDPRPPALADSILHGPSRRLVTW